MKIIHRCQRQACFGLQQPQYQFITIVYAPPKHVGFEAGFVKQCAEIFFSVQHLTLRYDTLLQCRATIHHDSGPRHNTTMEIEYQRGFATQKKEKEKTNTHKSKTMETFFGKASGC